MLVTLDLYQLFDGDKLDILKAESFIWSTYKKESMDLIKYSNDTISLDVEDYRKYEEYVDRLSKHVKGGKSGY